MSITKTDTTFRTVRLQVLHAIVWFFTHLIPIHVMWGTLKMTRSASGMNGSGSGHNSVKFYLLNVKPHNELTDSKFKLQNHFKCKLCLKTLIFRSSITFHTVCTVLAQSNGTQAFFCSEFIFRTILYRTRHTTFLFLLSFMSGIISL